MDNKDNIKKRKEELINNIKDSEKELQELRLKCKHEATAVKDVNPESGSSSLRKVCIVCEQSIGFPTNQELKDSGYMPK